MKARHPPTTGQLQCIFVGAFFRPWAYHGVHSCLWYLTTQEKYCQRQESNSILVLTLAFEFGKNWLQQSWCVFLKKKNVFRYCIILDLEPDLASVSPGRVEKAEVIAWVIHLSAALYCFGIPVLLPRSKQMEEDRTHVEAWNRMSASDLTNNGG